MKKPEEHGWYWVWDEELISPDKWAMAWIGCDVMVIYEPHPCKTWTFSWDADIDEWVSTGDRYTATNPTRYFRIEEPTKEILEACPRTGIWVSE